MMLLNFFQGFLYWCSEANFSCRISWHITSLHVITLLSCFPS